MPMEFCERESSPNFVTYHYSSPSSREHVAEASHRPETLQNMRFVTDFFRSSDSKAQRRPSNGSRRGKTLDRMVTGISSKLSFKRRKPQQGKDDLPPRVPTQLRPGPRTPPRLPGDMTSKMPVSSVIGYAELPAEIPQTLLPKMTPSTMLFELDSQPPAVPVSTQLPEAPARISIESSLFEEVTFWRKSEMHVKRLTAMVSQRSDESSWAPANSRPQGNNILADYQVIPAKRSIPNFPSGNTPEPALPHLHELSRKTRRSLSVCSRGSLTSLFPDPGLIVNVAKRSAAIVSSVTFDQILSEQKSLCLTQEPAGGLSIELAGNTALATSTRVKIESESSHGKSTLVLAPPPSSSGHSAAYVPTVSRPKRPQFSDAPEVVPSYEAFRPDTHVVDISAALQRMQDGHFGSTMKVNMANEMHFEHSQTLRPRRMSFLMQHEGSWQDCSLCSYLAQLLDRVGRLRIGAKSIGRESHGTLYQVF